MTQNPKYSKNYNHPPIQTLDYQNLNILNPTLKPLFGVEIELGKMQHTHYAMNVGKYISKNKLIFENKYLNRKCR